MSIVVNQATWGDETSATDITANVQKQASAGFLDLVADNTLVPAIDLSGGSTTVTLSDSDKAEITKQAATLCGSVSDTKCIQFQKNQLETSMLQQKTAEQQSSANVVTGRRLTLTYTDKSTGAQRTVAIPDGQKVKFGTPPVLTTANLPTLSGTALTAISTTGTIIGILLYTFSIAVTYRMLMLKGHLKTAYLLTAVAIFIPYSGLLTTPIALAIFSHLDANKVAASV
jgi:hypothetical protein